LLYLNQVSQTIFQLANTLTYAINLEYAIKTSDEKKIIFEYWNSQRVKNTLRSTLMNKGVSYSLTF